MSTRSSARNLFLPLDNPKLTIRRRSRSDPTLLNNSKMAAEGPGDLPVPDLRTMEELCQPSLNGGTFMKRRPEECYDLMENMTAHHNDWDTSTQRSESSSSINSSSDTKIAALKAEIEKINKNLMRVLQINQQVKAVTPNYETCGGPYSFSDCNTITNPKEDLKGITTRRGTAYPGPTIPTTSSSPVVECETKAIKDTMHPANNESTEDVQPPVVQSNSPILNTELVNSPINEHVASPVSALRPNHRSSIPYPSRLQDQKLHDKANDQREKFFQIFNDLNFNISFADALILMPKFGLSIKILLTNKDKICDLARTLLNEHCLVVLLKKLPEKLRDPGKFLIPCDFSRMAECLALANLGASINLIPLSVWNKLFLLDFSSTCMTLELADHLISHLVGVAEHVFVKVGTFHFPPDFVVVDFDADPRTITFNLDQTLRYSPNYSDTMAKRIHVIDMACEEYSQEVLGFFDVELKVLPPHFEYVFLEGDDKLPVIIAKDLSMEEKTALITVLKSYKRAIAWKLFDIKGIDLQFCTHKILIEEDFEPLVQHKRRVNPKIYYVIKQEVLKLLDAGCIYPISDTPWVSPVHCVPKKGGFTVVENKENELILTRLVTGWHVCIDYRKLNEATRKDHFPLPFIDQKLERLAGNQYYCFLDGFYGYFQIHIDLKDQEKTTFTSPYETFAYCRMPFGLCNAPGTFQRPIRYASKTMTEVESNYTTTEKEMLAVVYAFKKFRSYLIMNKSIVYTDHSTLKYLFAKKDSKERFLRWVLLIQEFTFKVIDTKGAENLAADHLFRLENPYQNVLDPKEINESFPLETLNLVSTHATPYHPQTSGQVEVSKHGLKRILERTLGENCASWSDKLDDSLWAF
nr:reverse transcriptase domain-containing protein [Tanacetum cinerariifolium]